MAFSSSFASFLPRRGAADGAASVDATSTEAIRPSQRQSRLKRLLGPYGRSPAHWGDRQVCFTLLSFLALVYLGLYHPYWARGGDSELYLVIARNLVRGQGFTYNEQMVGLVPPLWPYVLAGAMWLTSLMSVLKLLMPACYLVYLGCAYFVLRRMAGPWISAASVALTGTFFGLVTLTMWFHSDPLFFALSWSSLLLAVQASEKYRDEPTRISPWLIRSIGAAILCAAAIATRWPGLLWWPIVAVAFVNGRPFLRLSRDRRHLLVPWRPVRIDAMWIMAAGTALVACGTFLALRAWLRVDPGMINPRYDTFVVGNYELVNSHGNPTLFTYLYRALRGPEWLSLLYWNELGRTRITALGLSRLAAITAIPLAIGGIVGLMRRQWLWLGVAVAWLPIVLTWPHPIDRYSGPVAPFLVCGTILGTIWLARRLRAAWRVRYGEGRTVSRWIVINLPYLVMAVPLLVSLSYNGARYGLEFWVRMDYFPRYEGGVQPSLNRIAAYIRQNQPATGGEVAVTRTGIRSSDMEERRNAVRGPRRNLIFVTDTPAIDVPAVYDFAPTESWFLDWAISNRVRYFVVMPKQRRFFVHFRDVPWQSNPELAAENTDWQLWELVGAEDYGIRELRRVVAAGFPEEVFIVPGLEDVRDVGPLRGKLPIPYN